MAVKPRAAHMDTRPALVAKESAAELHGGTNGGREMKDQFFRIRQFAELGILSEYAIRKLVKEKKLPVVYVGNRAMLPYSQCLEALDRMAQENQAS